MRFHIASLISYPRIASGVRFVERIGSKLFPVGPNLLQNIGVVTICLALLNELRLHLVNDVFLLLTHRLTQSITLATGEVCQQTRQEHHLFLIHGDTVGVLQIFLHDRNIIGDERRIMFTLDEVGNVVHWTWTIQCVHSDQVFKHRWVKFTQVFLHTSRFKLECTHGLSSLVELICEFVVDRNGVDVNINASRKFHILHRLLQLR